MLAENKEGVGEIVALVLAIAPDAPAKRWAGEIVGGPGRLPRREEIAACFPQCGPFGAIRHLRRAQYDAIAGDRGYLLGQADGAEERHDAVIERRADRAERKSGAGLSRRSSDLKQRDGRDCRR